MRVVLVGSNPSEKSPDNTAFHAATRSRMAVDGWFDDLDVEIHFINVCDRTRPGNRPLRVSEIRESLPAFREKMTQFQNCKIVALGNTASKALDLLEVKYHKMPHPSGLNRYWNCSENTYRAIEGLRKYLHE